MTQDDRLAKAVSNFGAAAKAKLANIAVSGQPEDQLRGPFEALVPALAEAAGIAGEVVLVGETALSDLKTRPNCLVKVGVLRRKFITEMSRQEQEPLKLAPLK